MNSRYLIFTLFLIVYCKSQKPNIMKLPKIDDKTEIYKSNIADKFMTDVNTKNKKLPLKEQYGFGKKDKNGIGFRIYDPINKRDIVNYTKYDDNITGIDFSENLIFGVFKEYYNNMTLKTKGIYCVYGFKVGKWYHYDEKGNLISTEDTDKGYDFNYEDIIKYCEKNNIPLVHNDPPKSAQIQKIFFKEKYIWMIYYYDYPSGFVRVIHISGKDGSVLGVFNEGKIPVN